MEKTHTQVQFSYDGRKYSEDVDTKSQKLLKSGNISDLDNTSLNSGQPQKAVDVGTLKLKGSKGRVRGLP